MRLPNSFERVEDYRLYTKFEDSRQNLYMDYWYIDDFSLNDACHRIVFMNVRFFSIEADFFLYDGLYSRVKTPNFVEESDTPFPGILLEIGADAIENRNAKFYRFFLLGAGFCQIAASSFSVSPMDSFLAVEP